MSIADKLTTIAENEQKVYEKGYYDALLNWWDNFTLNGTKTSYIGSFQGTSIGDVVGLEKLPYPTR